MTDKSKQLRRRGQDYISQKKKKQSQTRRGRTACVASQYGFCFWLSQTLSVAIPTVWLLHLPAYPRGDAPHTHTDANTLTKSSELPVHTCSYKPQKLSQDTHTHTQSWAFKRNKSCRAGWSPFCFLSKSFIFAPQQEPRHHNSHSRYSVAVPTVKKTERPCAFVWYVYLSGPLRGQAAVLCGLRESFVTGKTAV